MPDYQHPPIEIAGAGPAGLAAALAITTAGRDARIYERRSEVGSRFHGDFQGLENWTTEMDVLDEISALGITTDFEHTPFYEVLGFDPDGVPHRFHSQKPLFYLVHRGSKEGSLDVALQHQAMAAGVELRFNEPVRHLPNGGVVTEGPHRADVIAAGYLFETDMADGAYAAVSDRLAPKGYAYLIVHAGQGTLASCLFDDFHNEHQYVERSLEFFSDKLGVRMQNPRRFGGSGNFSLPQRAHKGNLLYAGEAAGFQDPLFGFGIRWALLSGALAGTALAANQPQRYQRDWKHRLRAYHQTAATNRWFYDRLGDRGYRGLMQRYRKHTDIREWLHRTYLPKLWKQVWYHLVANDRRPLLLTSLEHCSCTWCRCAKQSYRPSPGSQV